MNENEMKKTPPTGNAPGTEDVKVYNDMDIFDFDAHRKNKAASQAPSALPQMPQPQSAPTASKAPARTAAATGTTPPRASDKKHTDIRTARSPYARYPTHICCAEAPRASSGALFHPRQRIGHQT